MKHIIFILLFFLTALQFVFGQPLSKFTHFTPECRQVLSKMGEFFDQTIRKNFPAEVDSLSYKYFADCFVQSGSNGMIILEVDKAALKEINMLLFEDYNYYFFYSRYLQIDKRSADAIQVPETDSVPTIRDYRPANQRLVGFWWLFGPVFNRDGYIKVVPTDNPAIRDMQRDVEAAGDLSITMFMANIMGVNLREISQPEVKELCAVVFWRYLCACGGVDLVGRKGYCENCQ